MKGSKYAGRNYIPPTRVAKNGDTSGKGSKPGSVKPMDECKSVKGS